ncbi:MAG: transposase [Verrucomicrobiota bacterium]
MTPPVRKDLPHAVPLSIRPDEAIFFITICCQAKSQNQLCLPEVAAQLLDSIKFRHAKGDWWVSIALLMPDHLHALVSFPSGKDMPSLVSLWKQYTAAKFGIKWQRDFFDHRLRSDESLRDKADYILNNPVRRGLVQKPENWPYVWWPKP